MSLLDRLPAPKQTQALSRWEQEDEGSLALAEAPAAPEQSVLGKVRHSADIQVLALFIRQSEPCLCSSVLGAPSIVLALHVEAAASCTVPPSHVLLCTLCQLHV